MRIIAQLLIIMILFHGQPGIVQPAVSGYMSACSYVMTGAKHKSGCGKGCSSCPMVTCSPASVFLPAGLLILKPAWRAVTKPFSPYKMADLTQYASCDWKPPKNV
jgi:hypothetical protein